MMTNERDIFLSHSNKDKATVRQIRDFIESSSVGERQLRAWMDEAEIKTGSITGHLNYGLETSRFVAFCLSPAYFQSSSGWTDAEWHAALFTDPDNRSGKLIPLLIEDSPYVPVLLRHLRMIDLRGRAFRRGMDDLVDILSGQSRSVPVTVRGQVIAPDQRISMSTLFAERATIQGLPDPVPERLYCNLLPVEQLPPYIYSAPLLLSSLKSRKDGTRAIPTKEQLKATIKENQSLLGIEKPRMPAFRIERDRIFTFHDLESSESPFVNIIQEKRIDRESLSEFIREEDNRNMAVSLFSMALDRHAYSIGLEKDPEFKKRGRYYFPPRDGGENIITWRPWKNQTSRSVAKPCLMDGVVQFWRHQAAYLGFQFIANRFFLRIEPTWVISKDGREIERGPTVGRLVTRWTGPERNLTLLYHIRFWTSILKRRSGRIVIRTGDQYMELSNTPAYVDQQVGILHDYKDLLVELDRQSRAVSSQEDARVEFAVEIAQSSDENFEQADPFEQGEESDESTQSSA